MKKIDEIANYINKRQVFDKYFLICNILEGIEHKYKVSINKFEYNDKRIKAQIGEKSWVSVDLTKDIKELGIYNTYN